MILGLILATVTATTPITSEITVYNANFGFVKEVRRATLDKGIQTLSISDVASQIEPETVSIQDLTGGKSFQVLEQNFRYDLIGVNSILDKSVGKHIHITEVIGNREKTISGVLLSAPETEVPATGASPGYGNYSYNGMVVKTDDGHIVLNPVGTVSVDQVPSGLISVPTLEWKLDSASSGAETIQLDYLTKGITWDANYVLVYNSIGKSQLQGWVTIDNQSGATYHHATLKLMAGDVHTVQPTYAMGRNFQGMGGGGIGGLGGFQQKPLFEYHQYKLQRPSTIRNNESKQIGFIDGHGLTVTKKLIIDSLGDQGIYYPNQDAVGTGDIKPHVYLDFKNAKANGLGIPLPKGTVRVYDRDQDGSMEFIGEDSMDHTPKDETVKLHVGDSFDVRASRKRTDFKVLGPTKTQESFELQIRNHKNVTQRVYVLERHYGDWNVISSSMKWTKQDATTMQYVVDIPANKSITIDYTIVTKW